MLTLQQILESDSIATLVAKLNANFQIVSNSNGGPQGIRGPQGIPGLPGRLGPTGATGPQGIAAPAVGVLPFAATVGGTANIGPLTGQTAQNGQPVEPWPIASWVWLMWYYGAGVNASLFPASIQSAGITAQGATANHGDIFIDHANSGFWKYLESPDIEGAATSVIPPYPTGYTSGGYYGNYASLATYPDLSTDIGWAGTGWYFYPQALPSAISSTVWVNDYTTYLQGPTAATGPYAAGPYTTDGASPLTIANARLLSKYGTVWITSGSEGTTAGTVGDENPFTTEIGKEWPGTAGAVSRPGRTNSGVDRLLFKMSLDTVPYLSNITARGWKNGSRTGITGFSGAITSNTSFPKDLANVAMSGGDNYVYWTKPQYEVTMEKFTPLLFLSERVPDDLDYGNYSSLGLYMHTSLDQGFTGITGHSPLNPQVSEGDHKSLFLWSSRRAPDPVIMYDTLSTPINSTDSRNFGEFLLDFRRLITSNQYVCSLPTDMRLSSDYVVVDEVSGNYYNENNTANVNYPYSNSVIPYSNAFRTYQGYISAINGKAMTGDPNAVDYWEYGLGDQEPLGPTGGTHDTYSGLTGMYTRRSWYGSSVLDSFPSDWEGTDPGTNNYVRVAGMMERGRRFAAQGDGFTASHFLSELIFYTSHFNVDLDGGFAPTNDNVNPGTNQHKSLPSLYVSPYRNIGIGTFVGYQNTYNAANDEGPLEPAARFHVHVKENDRTDDPTYTWMEVLNTALPGQYNNLPSYLPTEIFAAAAFSGDYGALNLQYVTDILLGNLSTPTGELVNPSNGLNPDVVNPMQDSPVAPNPTQNVLRNAIRTESWRNYRLNTMHLGAQPFEANVTIGRYSNLAYRNEFQLSLHPLTATVDGDMFLTSDLLAITGVGIHNLYPRARTHFYGKNLYNETEFGLEAIYPSYAAPTGLTATFPYYGATGSNQPSANQVVIDYIGESYVYPLGMYEYQYYAIPATAGITAGPFAYSPNAAVYPNRDAITPTRHGVPYYGGVYNAKTAAYNSPAPQAFNGSYRHGGTANAIWEPSSYIGFNLVRDLTSATDPTNPVTANKGGDDRDNTRWFLGTQGNNGLGNANNGGAAIMFSPHGELGIVTIPRGFDGGRAYEQWEQRGLSTRDVLNQMKLIVDKYGNVAVGNAAGWDLDAYPSLERNATTGYLNYVPITNPTTTGPTAAPGGGVGYTVGYWNAYGQYGRVNYPAVSPESAFLSTAALINKRATTKEYIRMEVAAEKAWSREGRELQKLGYGYPAQSTLTISGATLGNYVKMNAPYVPSAWALVTDFEGRIINNILTYTGGVGATAGSIAVAVFPHPREFNALGGALNGSVSPAAPSYLAPDGSLAAEWWGMSTDSSAALPSDTVVSGPSLNFIKLIPTTDERGAANLRLNNFVYGEGFGFDGLGILGSTGPQQLNPGLTTSPSIEGNFTQQTIRKKRQESPKLIFTFLERNPTVTESNARPNTSWDPYKKVNTVVQSAQNEASLREYWIPKTDNTGGTFMVFTDHMGSKEYQSGFDRQLTAITGITGGVTAGYTASGAFNNLMLYQVVTQEELRQYFSGANAAKPNYMITDTDTLNYWTSCQESDPFSSGFTATGIAPITSMGYVNYFNKLQYGNTGPTSGYGYTSYFAANEFGEVVNQVAPQTNVYINGPTGAAGTPYAYVVGTTGGTYIGWYPIDGSTGGTAATVGYDTVPGFQGASVRRNIEKYYSIMPGSTTNYDNGWNNPDFENQATEIRFKRINSEFVLVDFNITVRVDNPAIPLNEEQIPEDALDWNEFYIDFKSPRMTQYMSFIYKPDKEEDDVASKGPDFTENTYGNGPWFSEWSSYKKWNPGSAVVGGDTRKPQWSAEFDGLRPPIGPGVADDPFFVDVIASNQVYDETANRAYRTWNGNFIDYGAGVDYKQNILPILGYGQWGPGYGASHLGQDVFREINGERFTIGQANPIRPGYSAALINAWFSTNLTSRGTAFLSQDASDGYMFWQNMSKFYSVWGNHFLSRTRTMNWRISPTRWEHIPGNQSGANTNVNNAFMLEVMFDVPIIHCDHLLNDTVFTGNDPDSAANNYRPYQYLTVSGQSIIRYGKTRPASTGGGGGTE